MVSTRTSWRTQFGVLGLVLEGQVLGLEACKSSKRSCPWLEDSTIFWHVKNGPRSFPILFRLEERQRASEKKFWRYYEKRELAKKISWWTLEIFRKVTKFCSENFFFLKVTFVLCLSCLVLASSLGLKRLCPRKGCPWPWPQIFLCPWSWLRGLCFLLHSW